MPEDALEFEEGMHGGFNEDVNTGIVYTGIPGYGLCEISRDLKTWKRIGTDPLLKCNIHGLVVFDFDGDTLIAMTLNFEQKVVITDLEGNVKQVVDKPLGDEFQAEHINAYYLERKDVSENVMCCTDVTFLNGTLYVVTGYCQGDFVLTLNPVRNEDDTTTWKWGTTAWGGKGDEPGQFRTAHGVYAHQGHIYVANREANQVVKFTAEGEFCETFAGIPEGSRICNISWEEQNQFWVMNALEPLGNQTSAPIYAWAEGGVISTIIPGDLGIPILKHLHQVWPHLVDGQLYLLVHGWNAGKFAVLK